MQQRQPNINMTQNYGPQQRVCQYFQKDQCDKGALCKWEHKYEPCPDYDKGFCYRGYECPRKHIVRKMCMDYLYGFCKDGPDCKMIHVKLFQNKDVRNELKFTEQYYRLLKDLGVYSDLPEFKTVICNYCGEIGHKSNVCKNNPRPGSRLSPTRIILCGICNTDHQIQMQGKLPNCQFQKEVLEEKIQLQSIQKL